MSVGDVVRVLEVHRDGRAVVEVDGRRQEVMGLGFGEIRVRPGDCVRVKHGIAVERLSEAAAREALCGHLTVPELVE